MFVRFSRWLTRTPLLNVVCALVLTSAALAQEPAGAAPGGKTAAPAPGRVSLLAHRVLAAAVKSNGLVGDELKPWHLRADFQMLPDSRTTKPVNGTLEEWYRDPYHWRRTYTSSEPQWSGSEWRAGRIHRYVTKRKHMDFEAYWLTSRIGRPVVNPLYQVDNVRAEDELVVQRTTAAGVDLNCTSLAHPTEEQGRKPEWIVPTMCFDGSVHLRALRSEEILLQYEDYQPFQGHAVARHVQVISGGRLWSDMKVTLLESVDKVDEAILMPDADAAEQPYLLEKDDPQPVAIFQVPASIPLVGGLPPYRGSLAFPVILRKDGSVKVEGAVGGGPMQYVFDAVSNAVSRWKYNPYVLDGQPVEVEFRVIYNVDGKPFKPAVERQ